jgi:ABC-type multidrug transport system fused ATPase/permease subunit
VENGKDAIRYKSLNLIAIFSTLALTVINLAAPKLLSNMIQVVENGEKDAGRTIRLLTLALVGIYLIRILFRYLSNYLSHKAAWNLVEDHRIRVYDRIQDLPLPTGFPPYKTQT